jgi:hypothetical protein
MMKERCFVCISPLCLSCARLNLKTFFTYTVNMYLKTVTNSFLHQILSFIYCLLQRQQPRFRASAVLFLLFIFSEKRPDLDQIVPDWRKQYLLSVVTYLFICHVICSLFPLNSVSLDYSRSNGSFCSLQLDFFKDFFPILKGKYYKIVLCKFFHDRSFPSVHEYSFFVFFSHLFSSKNLDIFSGSRQPQATIKFPHDIFFL